MDWGSKHLSAVATSAAAKPSRRGRKSLRAALIGAAAAAATALVASVSLSASAAESPADGSACPASGHISYWQAPSAEPEAGKMKAAVDGALAYYNCYASLTREIKVYFDPNVPTAAGNKNGDLRFGSTTYMTVFTAMHEISHVLGVGQNSAWSTLVRNGTYTGAGGLAALRSATGDQGAVLNADTRHFWPYGLNQPSEANPASFRTHVQIVGAMVTVDGL